MAALARAASAKEVLRVAGLEAPKHLETLVSYLSAQKGLDVQKLDCAELHPLVVPLARNSQSGDITGVMAWPFRSKTLPVVRTASDSQIQLLARSAEGYLVAQAASADVSTGKVPAELLDAYTPGAAGSDQNSLLRYLAKRGDSAPWVLESLCKSHMDRGDVTAALVAAERAADLFGAWGRGYWFYSKLLRGLGRRDEARDAARATLLSSLWSVGSPVSEVAEALGDNLDDIARRIKKESDLELVLEHQMKSGSVLDETETCEGCAVRMLDLVTVGLEPGWQEVRPRLRDMLQKANLIHAAHLVDVEPSYDI